MTRRLLTLIAAAALMFSLVPGLPAAALVNANGSGIGRVVTGGNLLPGTGRDVAIEIRPDQRVNWVQIDVPRTMAGITALPGTLTAPEGWTGTVHGDINSHSLVFAGGPATIGQPIVFGFKADVARPQNRDLVGWYEVQVSTNGGLSSGPISDASSRPGDPNGTLSSTVRILETLSTVLLSPNGITDGTGTSGQTIQVRTTIRNHAIDAVTVTPTLSSSSPVLVPNDDVVGQADPATRSISGMGGSGTFAFPVTLGTTRDQFNQTVSTRQATFTGGGRVVRDNNTVATALTSSVGFVIERAPIVALPSTANVAPRLLVPGQQVTVEVPMRKQRVPGVTVTSGQLIFGDTTCNLAESAAFGRENNTDATLKFSCQVQELAEGREETFPADLVLTGTDDNDAPFAHEARPQRDQRTPASTLTFTIDALIPIITVDFDLPRDGDLREQDAAKPGDTIRVSGTIADFRHDLESVVIRPDAGEDIVVPVERIPDPLNIDGDRFIGQVTANFAEAATEAQVIATGTSVAGNIGRGFSETFDVLTGIPSLDLGWTISTTDLEGVVFDGEDFEPTAIRVEFGGHESVRGGCNPGAWSVDGAQVVVAVLYSSGTELCEPGDEGERDDNQRVLLLGVPIERNDTPSVTYTPLPGDRAKDRAGNFVPTTTIDTQSLIRPPLVNVLDVYRNTSGADTSQLDPCDPDAGKCEYAYLDSQYEEGGSAYFTRFSGNDLIVRVGRAAPNYRLEVLVDGVLSATKSLNESTGWIRVPLGSVDKEYRVDLQFRNLGNNLTSSGLTTINVVLDRVRPTLDHADPLDSVVPDETRWRIAFTEKVVAGLDAAANWRIYEEVPGGFHTYGANSVDRERQEGDILLRFEHTTRIITFTERGRGELTGAGYLFNPTVVDNTRYEDRAGNLMADIDQPAARPNQGLL